MKKLLMLLLLLSLSINLVGCNSKEETSDEVITNEEVEIDEEKNLNEVLEELDKSFMESEDFKLTISYMGKAPNKEFKGCKHDKYIVDIRGEQKGQAFRENRIVCINDDCDSDISLKNQTPVEVVEAIKKVINEHCEVVLKNIYY